ncbi:MAG: ATP-binding protein [Planctomycetes bacterium]|nr:ATP-binding protein [Planctomycetota bacterium]
MAQVSKDGPSTPPSDVPQGAGAPGAAQPGGPKPPLRHNLPMKTAPVVGRRQEMQAIAAAFERSRAAGRPGRVEVVGRPGIGATTVALELARRAGARFAGGAWLMDVGMGADMAWADVAAVRGRGRTSDLAATARKEKENFAEGPQAILVLDGIRNADDLLAAMPLESRTPPFVFAVCEKPTGVTDDVVEVSDVPPQGARRICQAMLQNAEGVEVPAVRSIDGLGITTSIAARTAMALQGRAGPLLIEDLPSATMRLIPLVAQNSTCLELLLLASVMHPSRIAVDALFGGVTAVRRGRGEEPKPEEIGNAILILARAGLVDPQDDRRISMHPMIQDLVRQMAKGEEDLLVARESAAWGLCQEAEAAMEAADGVEGVELITCGLHQLRHVEAQLAGEAKAAVADVRGRLEKALAITA